MTTVSPSKHPAVAVNGMRSLRQFVRCVIHLVAAAVKLVCRLFYVQSTREDEVQRNEVWSSGCLHQPSTFSYSVVKNFLLEAI